MSFYFFLCPVYGAGLTVWYLTRLVVIWCNAAVVVSITQGETQQLNFQNERRNKFAYMYIHRQFTFQLYCYTLSPTPVLCLLVPLARSLTPRCALNLSSRCRAAIIANYLLPPEGKCRQADSNQTQPSSRRGCAAEGSRIFFHIFLVYLFILRPITVTVRFGSPSLRFHGMCHQMLKTVHALAVFFSLECEWFKICM